MLSTETALEIFGVVSSLLYLLFSVRQSIWLWPLGIISSAVYVWVFFDAKLYADAGLYIYYVVISVYGWHRWLQGRKNTQQKDDLPVSRSSRKEIWVYGLASVLLFGGFAFMLHFTDSDVPYGDAFTTALSVVATYMLTQKKLGQWLVWIVVDMVALGLYIYKGLYPTAFLFLVYTLIAVWGYTDWKKSMLRTQPTPQP